MKRIEKSSELLWLLGNIFVALGVTLCSKAGLGVSMIAAPAFIVSEALSGVIPMMSVGITEYIIQGLVLLLMCVLVRRFNWRYLLSFAVAIVYGYILDFFLWSFGWIDGGGVGQRWLLLILGDLCTGFGVACFFRTYMPLQVYELFVAEVAHSFKINITRIKWLFDTSLFIVSVLLALTLFGDVKSFDWTSIGHQSFHSIGLGTLVTTIINSPVIALMSKLVNSIFDSAPRFKKIETFLKRQ